MGEGVTGPKLEKKKKTFLGNENKHCNNGMYSQKEASNYQIWWVFLENTEKSSARKAPTTMFSWKAPFWLCAKLLHC